MFQTLRLATEPYSTDTLVLPLFEGDMKRKPTHLVKYNDTLNLLGVTGKRNEVHTFIHQKQRIVLFGLGAQNEYQTYYIQESLGKALRSLRDTKEHVSIDLRSFAKKDLLDLVYEAAFTAPLALYEFHKYKTETTTPKPKKVTLVVKSKTKDLTVATTQAIAIAKGVEHTRALVNEPSNIATPKFMADHIKKDGKALGLKVEVFDHKKILKMGMNLVDAVGRASSDEPMFVKVTYKGKPAVKKHTALVGKGVCFDTGGVQNKPDFSMSTMKSDMGGAATAYGIIRTLAELKAKINIVAYLPFVKNAIGGNAFVPDDVYVAYNKKTVEITHTDAEGRLILADALAYASSEKPEAIYNFATLTGASVIALGSEFISMMGTHQEAMSTLQTNGANIDDRAWQLPFHEKYKEFFKSSVADLTNLPKTRMQPGTISAGMFLQHFVEEGINWIHNDIASVATHDGQAHALYSSFGTGKGVRLYTEFLLG